MKYSQLIFLFSGLFQSKDAVVNPSKQQEKASRKRLRRARSVLDEMRLPPELRNEEDCLFETEGDIRDFVEARILESMRTGKFDNLKNKGRPLPNQPSSTHEYAMRIMRDNGLRPYWLQLMHDIDTEKRQIRATLSYAWHSHMPHAPHRWALAMRVAELRMQSVNKQVDTFNLVRPMSVSHLFRLRLRIKDEVERAMKSDPPAPLKLKTETQQKSAQSSTDTKEEEPRPSWQLFARFVKATDVREYERPTWGRRKSEEDDEQNS